jgi:anti-repressor protein|nr:MAG TPA_asm: KilAC domain protein [Caudoviricetes sp.]
MSADLVMLKDRQAVTSSLNVSTTFDKRHDHILRNIDGLKRDVPNFGEMFAESSLPDSYGRDRRIYYMNRDGFTLLAMGFTGNKALKFKLEYIEAFNAMEEKIRKEHLSSYMIDDPIKRAEKWIEEETVRKEQAAEIERMRPKEIFSDAITASNTSILVGDLAKILKGNGVDIGQKRLFNWMRENGYLIRGKRSDRNMPTQKSMDLGLFEIKESSYISGDGVNHITKTPKVTGKGQKYFINKFLAMQEEEAKC